MQMWEGFVGVMCHQVLLRSAFVHDSGVIACWGKSFKRVPAQYGKRDCEAREMTVWAGFTLRRNWTVLGLPWTLFRAGM